MFKRTLLTYAQWLAKKHPVLTILGPRQSSKTILVRTAFLDKPYVNMEDAENRSLIQVIVDEKRQNGMFILTGSH